MSYVIKKYEVRANPELSLLPFSYNLESWRRVKRARETALELSSYFSILKEEIQKLETAGTISLNVGSSSVVAYEIIEFSTVDGYFQFINSEVVPFKRISTLVKKIQFEFGAACYFFSAAGENLSVLPSAEDIALQNLSREFTIFDPTLEIELISLAKRTNFAQ